MRPARRHLATFTGLALLGGILTGVGAAPAPAAARTPLYLDAKAPIPDRVADLLHRMTLKEKIGQMDQEALVTVQGTCNWSGGALNDACLHSVLVDNAAGSILSGGGMPPAVNTPEDWARMTNTIQRYAITNSRLHIPILYGIDAVHGHNNVLGATMFPQQIGMGATWDPALERSVEQSTQRAVAATGINWAFGPVAEVARDQRWGRYYEAFSEDPLLTGTMAASAVKGLQDASSGTRIAATVKHFAGYSQPLNGHDRVPADYSPRYLQDTILPAYRQAIGAGALSVMADSGAVNGVPVTASHYLLTTVLRDQYHFDGVVVSDWSDVRNLQTAYHIAADYPDAIAKAVNAGVDMAMEPTNATDFTNSALAAVQRGLISQQRIDQAVSRILTMKFKLGLFEHPYVDASKADAIVDGADLPLARQAATESSVLLRNQGGVLPFGSDVHKIVVTGPSADNIDNQMGGWTIGWQGVPSGTDVGGTTVLAGLREEAPAGTSIDYQADAGAAVGDLKSADAAVVVVGDTPGAEGPNDHPDPELAPDQQAEVAALQATGKPVVVVVIADRPLVLGGAANTAGLLMAWLPGTEGGHAVADLLYGKANPSGRLPVSWPKAIGNEPEFYTQLPGTNSGTDSGYSPLFAFGAGLSYTSYQIGAPTPDRTTVGTHGSLTVSVPVADTGSTAGDAVVPLYVSQPVSQVLTPAKWLVGFTRVHLDAGAHTTVRITVPLSLLAHTEGDVDSEGGQVVEPGSYTLLAGDATTGTSFTVS
ncbi:glycoside hydrolase family 3 N-terminal domain-containing protein [Streptacidiphilus anmyonensis]|uniref:glycoside hydrolase family 3 N-terminal domain-containing protein n=1 Tax=Streptacidiphilus anmyonensis TaxID=405782 RepID=UPI0006941A1B|nr:glycoside hydrolase family 3 N-terminal domain-containing protein [Streptacidiphilus anmyonensis]